MSDNQSFRKKLQKKDEKSCAYIWQLSVNPLLLHPLSERKRRLNDMMETAEPGRQAFVALFKRGGRKKTSGKIWRIYKKLLTFASAFRFRPAGTLKKRSLNRFT